MSNELIPFQPEVGEVERLPPRRYGFESDPVRDQKVLEPCKRCGGMHENNMLTVCKLLDAKDVLMGREI